MSLTIKFFLAIFAVYVLVTVALEIFMRVAVHNGWTFYTVANGIEHFVKGMAFGLGIIFAAALFVQYVGDYNKEAAQGRIEAREHEK